MSRRVVVFVALVALAVVGGLADRSPARQPVRAKGVSRVATMPVAAPGTSLSSTWFCAGGTATADGVADQWVTVANAGTRELTGTLKVVPSEGDPRTVPLTVGPRSRATFHPRDVLEAPYVASLVEFDGGDVVVEHEITGPLGTSVAPCASSASDRWYFAEGSTAREGNAPEDEMLLALYNPFPEDAIVDLAFSTDQGRAVPSDFTGIVVKGGRLSVIDVGTHVRRRNNVSVTVASRSGRLVVDRIQLRHGTAKGMSLALGVPSPGSIWYFAEGLVADGVAERLHVYNPTSKEAEVSIELSLEEGAAEPFDLTILPRERVTVLVNDEERIPKGVGHSAVVRSLNDVPVVAERSVTAVPPASRLGASDTPGARMTARTWVLSSGAATDTIDEWVMVFNPGRKAATVEIQALASGQLQRIDPLRAVQVPAGHRVAIRMTDHLRRDDLALLIGSSEPVVVERGIYRVGSPGLALSPGVPLR